MTKLVFNSQRMFMSQSKRGPLGSTEGNQS